MRYLLVMLIAVSTVGAQKTGTVPASTRTVPGSDSVFLNAQRLVNEGRGTEGRSIVDSMFRQAAPGTPAQAEALFWRATLATTAAEAERDYRQITVEHPLSRRAEDALLRLAQLELQRGERTLALAHLDRLLREHGNGPARARGAYWSARVHFEQNDVARACRSLGDARLAVSADDVELRNQIEYAAQRCPVTMAAVRPTPPVVTPPPVSSSVSAAVPPQTTPSVPGPTQTPRDTTTTRPATPAIDSLRSRADSAPVPATPTPPVAKPVAKPAQAVPAAAEPQRFSVQVAAYQTKAEADRLVRKYRGNGYDARAFGTVAPFRVRIGRFKTRAEAVALAKVLKEKSGAAFVVVAEPR